MLILQNIGVKNYSMDDSKVIYLKDRSEWRSWLTENFDSETEIWLIFPHKDTGKPRVSYNDAVEEALCFGWIDSIIKKHGSQASKQRFTPRRPKSGYSQPNKERMIWLHRNGLVHPSLEATAQSFINEEFIFPDDIIEALKKDPEVWYNFQQFSDSYKRIRVAYIDTTRSRPEYFEKRLKHFIAKTKENKQIGYGGIDKYY